MDEEKGVRDSFGTSHVEGILTADGGRHWCLAVVVLMQYSASISLSLAQCVPDTTNGRLRFENMTMYRLGSSSRMAMFISPQSRKRKMATGRRFGSLCWRSSSECSAAWLVELVITLSVIDVGVRTCWLGHRIGGYKRGLNGKVGRASEASSEFTSFESVFERQSAPKCVQDSPSPTRRLGG